jgi:NTE family protein
MDMVVEESAQVKTKISIHYDNVYKAGLMTNLTLRNVLAKGTRASITADISENPEFEVSLINFLGERQITAGKVGFNFENNNFPVYMDDGSKYGTFTQYYMNVRAGLMFLMNTKWQTDAYLNYKTSTLQNKSGFSDIFYTGAKRFGNSFISANFDLNYNSLDSRYFPQKGSKLELNYLFNLDVSTIYKGTDEGQAQVSALTETPYKKYFSASANYSKFVQLNSRLISGLRLSGTFVSRSTPLLGLTYIGGLPFNNRGNEVSFIGYSFREKLAEDFILGEINLRYKLLNKIHLSMLFNALLSNINLSDEIEPIGLDKDQEVYGYGLILAYDSFLGPLQMGMGSNDSDNRMRWFFNFGFTF